MKVTQIALTIQGEGQLLGYPSILVRLNNCNLCCPYCDTKWSLNNKDSIDYTPQELFNYIKEKYFSKYEKVAFYPNIMFTGGEPLLYSEEIIEFIYIYNKFIAKETYGVMPIVDIETNGMLLTTQINDDVFYETEIDINFNISPKLQSNCYKDNKSLDDIISIYKKIIPQPNINYKIVYKKEWEQDINQFINEVELDKHNVKMMPFTHIPGIKGFDNLFHRSNLDTIDYCIRKGVPYTPRQHIYLFGTGSKEFEDI